MSTREQNPTPAPAAKEAFLGDGLYARFDGCGIELRAPRENGDHYVVLDTEVLTNFLKFAEKCYGAKITVNGESI